MMTANQDITSQSTISAEYSTSFELLENPGWQTAQSVSITQDWSGRDAPENRHAEVRLLWTDQALLVHFVCRQTEPLIVNPKPQFSKKTLRLWDNDVCEVFLAPDLNRCEHYFEFEAAPTGEWVDLGIRVTGEGRETDWDFHSGMAVAVKLGSAEFTLIMRIPWSESLPKPEAGDTWRLNLFRCIGTGDERFLAWLPTHTPEPYFHIPEVFGELKFG